MKKTIFIFALLISQLTSFSQIIVTDPALESLTTINLDSYNGTRITPENTTINGFHITKNTNTNIGFSTINTDTSGNAAQANVFVKGSGPAYTNYTGLSHYNNGYYVSWLRNSGLLFSDSPLYIGTWNNKPIEFRSGPTFTTMTSKLRIDSSGQINIGNIPMVDNSAVILGRKSNGDIVGITNTINYIETVPISTTSVGIKGQIASDSTYVYLCVETNTWIRFEIDTTF